ncbi:unnamed protein product [Lampetra fluviatilis]
MDERPNGTSHELICPQMGFGSFLAIIGINLNANKRPMLVAAIIFISFGVAAAFSCAVVDGVFAARHIDPSPVLAGRCLYFPGDGKYSYEDYSTERSPV